MSQPQPAQTLASHLIAQTISSVALLESLGLVSADDAAAIRARLPNPYAAFPALAMGQPAGTSGGAGGMSPLPTPGASSSDLNGGMGALSTGDGRGQGYGGPQHAGPGGHSVPPLPPRGKQEIRARALWDYHGAEADDLAFRQGDVIIIDEEVNEQWSRGRVIPQGQAYPLDRAGLFPANYVEKLPPGPPGPPPINPAAMVPYQPAYDPNPSQGSLVLPPTQQAVAVPQQQQGDGKKPGRFGKYGSQLGTAAVNGAGFGFGASVASNIVNAIL